ncbi:MAG: PBP1A family penicillin-binding protein [Candidatus Nealsonbacteria bacterium]|nr:PBP1A family penicillin-binding protein [Candidatus Nealsonbacteria bacterium]
MSKKIKLILKLSGGCLLLFIFCGSLLFIYYAKDLPRPEFFTERPFVLPTKIYDRSGETLLYQIYDEEKRTIVSLDKVPNSLKQAVLATEDSNFYSHFGLDLGGIFRSIVNNIKIGKPIYGGSTLSQQLIRSSFLTMDKTMQRKTKEIILTFELERRYSKDRILEFYLNQVPFGSNAYGVEAASQTFFEKPVSEISLAESALLASLIQAPSRLSPYGSYIEDLLARKNYVLDRMAEENYISKEEAVQAQEQDLEFAKVRQPIKAPHFVLYVKKYLEEKYSDYFLKQKGLKVYTTLDWTLQTEAEKIVKEGVKANKAYDANNASLVAINPQTGEILTMVGSADWNEAESFPEGCTGSKEGCLFDPKFNIATLGERQPGSAFKPLAYAQIFKNGLTPKTVLWDVKTEFNPNCASTAIEEKDEYGMDCYHPENYSGTFRGPINLRNALAQSINLPAVKVLYLAGVKDTIDLAKSLGITTLTQPLSWYGLSLVLGGGEVKLLDITSAYGVFAARGLRVPPVAVLKIEDSEGNIIEENKKTQKRVLEPKVADLINSVLSDNAARAPMFGLYSVLSLPGHQVAAKTGTTQEYKDAWTIGYSTSLAVGVWAGNNNNTSMQKKPGVVLAGVMWNQFMKKALEIYPGESFSPPEILKTNIPILDGEVDLKNPHSILYYIDKNNPLGEAPKDPSSSSQYENWEEGIQNWLK